MFAADCGRPLPIKVGAAIGRYGQRARLSMRLALVLTVGCEGCDGFRHDLGSTMTRPAPPYCVQGSDDPAFRGNEPTGVSFVCQGGCGQILIEEYDPESYVSVGIQCFKCKGVSVTPNLPRGEVFAASMVSLGADGAYLLGSTVNVPPGVILTTDQEIQREIALTAPRDESVKFELSQNGISEICSIYISATGVDLGQQIKTVNRLGVEAAIIFPFAWSISHLSDRIDKNILDVGKPDTATALLWVRQFCHVVGTWQHHPRFRVVASGLGKPRSFLHTSTELIAAAYLYHAGNRVGLSLEDKPNEPNPDLYVRGVRGGKFYLEVKAPEPLQWSSKQEIDTAIIAKAVKSSVKKSTRQINKSRTGILIISSSLIWDGSSKVLEEAIVKAIKADGRNHRHLAAVVGVVPQDYNIGMPSQGSMNMSVSYNFSVTLNEHFSGENPVNIAPRR